MAEFPGGAWWPERRVWGIGDVENGGTPSMQHIAPWGAGVSATSYTRVAWIMQAPHAGTLSGFSMLLGMLQDVLVVSTWHFSIQSLDASGYPSGTGTPGVTFPGTAWPSHGSYTAMTGAYDVDKGDLFACVAECLSGNDYTLGTFFATLHPGYASQPVYSMQYLPSTDAWTTVHSGIRPCLVLHYTSGGPDRPPDDGLPMGDTQFDPSGIDLDPPGRMGNLLTTPDPVGMRFQVPRSLICDGFAFNFECTTPVQATLTGGDIATGGVIPGWPSTTPGNRVVTFSSVTLRPGVTYEAAIVPTTGTLLIHGYPIAPDGEDDFEGGPTWRAFGDPVEGMTDRWFFSLHIPGPAEEEASGIAGFTVRDCVVTPVCPEEEEPGPAATAPTLFAAWRVGGGPLQPRARRRRA